MDCGPPGSSFYRIFQARIPEWLPFPSAGDVRTQGLNPGLQHCRLTLYCLSPRGSPNHRVCKTCVYNLKRKAKWARNRTLPALYIIVLRFAKFSQHKWLLVEGLPPCIFGFSQILWRDFLLYLIHLSLLSSTLLKSILSSFSISCHLWKSCSELHTPPQAEVEFSNVAL